MSTSLRPSPVTSATVTDRPGPTGDAWYGANPGVGARAWAAPPRARTTGTTLTAIATTTARAVALRRCSVDAMVGLSAPGVGLLSPRPAVFVLDPSRWASS